MKRLSTSLLIFILALLAVPERMWAWTSVEFRASFDGWATGHTMTRNDANSFTYEFAASEDFTFKFYVSDNNGLWLGYYDTSSQTVSNYDGNVTYWCNNIKNTENNITFKVDSRYKKYKIDLSWDNQSGDIHYFKYTVTGITEGGSSDPVSYALVGDFGSPTWEWNDSYVFKKTADNTYSLDIASSTFSGKSFKLKYKEGTKEGWAAGPASDHLTITLGEAVSFDGNGGKNYVFPTLDNKDYVIELTTTATTAGSFTVKEKTSAPEKKYTVTISAGEGGSVSLTGDQQIGSTPVNITATAKSGYEFVNWTVSDGVTVANASVAKTTVKATKTGTLKANFQPKSTPDPTPTPTPILGNNFYLVGDLFDNETSINYDTRYFKFTDNGNNSYSLDIPATLEVNAQILSVDGSTEKVYGPSTGQNGFDVTSSSPSDNQQISGALSEGSKTLAYYWNFQNRTLASDGIYTITITLNSEGVPSSWTIKHDKTRRVAYYLSNSAGSTAQAAYAEKKDNGNGGCDNRFFGSVFLSKGTGCYVISNITKEADNNYNSLLKTTTKFYLQGNKTGGSPVTGNSNETKVFPVKYNGSETSYKPFVFSNDQDLQLLLQYNPSQGEHETAQNYSYIGGEVLRADYQDASGVKLPQITGMKIVGPAVNNSWNLDDAVQMTYNDADNCWEAIINTSAKAGEKFRFVANNTWENSWQENGIEATDKAKIPYNGTGEGQAATTADPNEVSYISLTENQVRDENYDIIFNRDHGTWRVRFYIETQSASGGNSYKYVFKYTINGYESVVRTYCSNENQIPTDKSIKIYGAYAFEGDEATNSGTIKLYEMNYIPANEGVILFSTNAIEGWNFEHYTRPEGETMYKKIPDDDYINYLVGTTKDITVTASKFDGNNVRTHRNFFFNYLKNTGYYTEGDTDYLGFFRIKSGSTCTANHAYLSLPTNVLAWNGQTFEQVMESGEQAALTKGMRIVFSDGSDWVEDVPTSITTIKDKNRVFDNYYYTLQGVRVEKPLKGIYIHNGKKVVIK